MASSLKPILKELESLLSVGMHAKLDTGPLNDGRKANGVGAKRPFYFDGSSRYFCWQKDDLVTLIRHTHYQFGSLQRYTTSHRFLRERNTFQTHPLVVLQQFGRSGNRNMTYDPHG